MSHFRKLHPRIERKVGFGRAIVWAWAWAWAVGFGTDRPARAAKAARAAGSGGRPRRQGAQGSRRGQGGPGGQGSQGGQRSQEGLSMCMERQKLQFIVVEICALSAVLSIMAGKPDPQLSGKISCEHSCSEFGPCSNDAFRACVCVIHYVISIRQNTLQVDHEQELFRCAPSSRIANVNRDLCLQLLRSHWLKPRPGLDILVKFFIG